MDDRVRAVRFISLEIRGAVMSGLEFPARAARWTCIWGLLAEISGVAGMSGAKFPARAARWTCIWGLPAENAPVMLAVRGAVISEVAGAVIREVGGAAIR